MVDVGDSRCDGADEMKEHPVKRSIIWTTAGIAAVGFGVPAYAAITTPHEMLQIAPTPVETVAPATDDNATVTSLDDSTVTLASTPASLPTISLSIPSSDDPTSNSVDDNATGSSVGDDATPNSVEDVSG